MASPSTSSGYARAATVCPGSVIRLRGLTGQAPSATAARMLLPRSGAKSGLGELLGAVEFRRDHGVIGCVLHIESGIVGFHVVD
jgi:hypothetical protein